ncbi:mannan-binding lectin [Catenovulum maritimum]|uniref:Mannan-binding protein domain-containing protein n=1 Tax=Catenovulum maritimum TaxID=1513271 RepID=A0A0J8H0H4_9ALTE|nr:mannan-binding lectin [Catenovulum maritimum]KMT66969.1 hypothetical protein XM47_02425 [Catenovulum maritimum]
MKHFKYLLILSSFLLCTAVQAKGKFGIDAYSLNKAVCYQGSSYKSTFTKVGHKKWLEVNEVGTRINWQERNRDEWSVYLMDSSRKMNLQIDLHTTKVAWGYFNQATSNELCRIKNANGNAQGQAAARSQEQVCKSLVQGKVAWSRGGSKNWQTSNLHKLCKNSPNAAKTVQCFKAAINKHNNWSKGIKECSGNKKAINAGPIWNQNDAKQKCPRVASQNGGKWTGGWWTTVQGKMSVCEIKFD